MKLPITAFTLPAPNPAEPDARFLERFELDDAMRIASDEGREHIARKLLEGITLDAQLFAETLSADLANRIDENIIGGLAYLADGRGDIDHNLQYGQFWRERGIELAKAGVREPSLGEAFDRWRADGEATYTVRKIERWRHQAELIARCNRPATAIDRWWCIEKMIRSLESSIGEAVSQYDDQINSEIHDRR